MFEVRESSIWVHRSFREGLIRDRLATAYSGQKSYVVNRKRHLDFNVGDQVYLKISPMKRVMWFCIKGKLSLMYVGPYEIFTVCE